MLEDKHTIDPYTNPESYLTFKFVCDLLVLFTNKRFEELPKLITINCLLCDFKTRSN